MVCTDTDKENNIYLKGLMTFDGVEYWDYCRGDELAQYTCSLAHRPPQPEYISCRIGCLDGACMSGGGGDDAVNSPGLFGVDVR